MKTGKQSIIRYISVFVISFAVGLFAGKLAVPVTSTQALSDLNVNATESNTSVIEKKEGIAEVALDNIVNIETSTASASNTSNTDNGLYMPSIGFYSGVSSASVSGGAIQVPASGVAKYGNLLVGHNPGTFSAILNTSIGDVFYLYGQKYQITSTSVLTVSDNMKFVGQETTSSLANKSGLVLMTCYGEMRDFTLSNGSTYRSASQRYLVFAQAV